MNMSNRIRRSISNSGRDVFLRDDFSRFGSTAQVSRVLSDLTTSGAVVKLGLGVYAKAKRSVLSGAPIPVKPLEVLAPEALIRLGVAIRPSRRAQAYNSGSSTQIPVGVVVNTGARRIGRKLGFNGKLVEYERA